MGKRVLVVGLDSAPPELVFERWKNDLPNLKRLMEEGLYGRLESTVPPITIPAWTSMMTSKNPGRLGFYGMRNRVDRSYERMTFANSLLVKEDRLWDILSRRGKKVTLIGVPQTYPPRPVNGQMVSCFLAPDTRSNYTYPPSLKEEIRSWVGEYLIDVDHFRTDDKDSLLKQLYEMTEKRFEVAKHLLAGKSWDFFMMVEMGTDRIHHGFWKYSDPAHAKYVPGSKYESAIRDYYVFCDRKLGELLSLVDDQTTVIVVSDHGAKAMSGGICVNEWLLQKGYLHLLEKPAGIVPIAKVKIDWKKTAAWGEGGYYSRIFLNVKGREPEGVIDPSDYKSVREELKHGLESISDEKGNEIGTKVFKPEEVYGETRGIPPDLIVYFGNLSWRSVGSLGSGEILTFENDTGPDDANHDTHGIFIMKGPDVKGCGVREGLRLFDVAPTVLHAFGMEVPGDMEGRIIT
jgi:predicted AlkP superfamily phosphohydrolase/phosphomutase